MYNPNCTTWTFHTKRSMNTFYFSGSICRKQILTNQNLFIQNCVYYWSSIQNKPPHTVLSWSLWLKWMSPQSVRKIYLQHKKKQIIFNTTLIESSRSLQQTVPLSFLLQFFVNTADLSRFSLANSFQATLWRGIIGLSFK